MKKPRNRAAQEATLINLRALKKRVQCLEDKLAAIEPMKLAATGETLRAYFKRLGIQ